MANPIVNFTHEELQALAQKLVSNRVKAIQDLFSEASMRTISQDVEAVKGYFSEMALIWKELAPAEDIARTLFPNLAWLFDLLDKVVAFESELLIAANKKN